MGYPGNEWPSPYGDPPDAAAASGGHDPYRGYPPLEEPEGGHYGDTSYGTGQQAPYGTGQQSPYGTGQQFPYGTGQQAPYGTGQQSPYGAPGPSGPYGPPGPHYGEPSGYGYAPSGPQSPLALPGPGGDYGMPPGGPSGKSRLPLIIGGVIGAVVLLGGGGTALAFALKGGGTPQPHPTKTAAQPTQTAQTAHPTQVSTHPATGRWKMIASRATDPQPLTLSEMFGRTHLADRGRSYRLVTRQITGNCRAAVTGSRLRGALASGKCTQLLRATYLRGDGKVMGTISISNLSGAAGVRKAFLAAAGGKQYVTPLRSASGRTSQLGRGAALGIRQVKGHYLILSWVQYADGHKPTSVAGRKQLAVFHADVVSTALTRPLSYRMNTGRPKQ